ncbi:hypothetical protein BGX21_009282 [Mortierella sp. AD011]|nr:hypothetical protein BGX21_009282 [Mortierella sp. AD011]
MNPKFVANVGSSDGDEIHNYSFSFWGALLVDGPANTPTCVPTPAPVRVPEPAVAPVPAHAPVPALVRVPAPVSARARARARARALTPAPDLDDCPGIDCYSIRPYSDQSQLRQPLTY